MAKKGTRPNKRSQKKILNAFEIAERQIGNHSDDETGDDHRFDDDDDINIHKGVMDASKFARDGKGGGNDEDEEIDSDEALGSDDDYDVLESKFSHRIRAKQKRTQADEDEDEGYSSIDESQLVGLSEAWDMDEKDLNRAKASGNKDIVLDDAWESESEEEGEDASESDAESDDSEEESEESEKEDIFKNDSEEEVDLSNTVSHLKSQLKKPPKERKRLLNETIEENEYNVPNNGSKLSLNDMISAVDSGVSKDAILLNKEDKSQALDTPLPKNIQRKHERRAAYDITKDEVSKWEDTVQQNRRAEVLKFPMNPTVKHNDSAVTFKSENEPANELEEKIHGVLEQSALVDDKKESTFEDLAVAKMSPEEMKKRTNELRLMRELMFRDEARAKRIKKIKSKSYRKVHKRQRMKEEAMVEGSDADSDKEDHDRKRAEERMNLKHKTQSGWAKSMVKSGLTKDASTREEMEEMLRQGERLRSKQLGYEEGEQSDENASDIEKEYAQDEDTNKSTIGKGVLGMDFMKAAEERERQENLKELEMLRQLENGEDAKEFEEDASAVNVIKNQGRRVYTPSASAAKADTNEHNRKIREEIEEDESSNLVNRLTKPSNSIEKDDAKDESTNGSKDDREEQTKETESNPWLLAGDTKKSSKVRTVDKDSSKQSKAANKIKKTNQSRLTHDDDDIEVGQTLDIDINDSDGEEFKQQDLVGEAFAGDNVVTEFEREKKRVVKDEDDQEEDLTLPGWGDWAGGSKKKKKRKIVRKIDGVAQKDKRRDKNLKDVIVNEKVNKKNLKYQSSDVPYPYESREQYERALRMPVGQQWTSRETHQRLTMPRVITKQGTVIDPLKAPFK